MVTCVFSPRLANLHELAKRLFHFHSLDLIRAVMARDEINDARLFGFAEICQCRLNQFVILAHNIPSSQVWPDAVALASVLRIVIRADNCNRIAVFRDRFSVCLKLHNSPFEM